MNEMCTIALQYKQAKHNFDCTYLSRNTVFMICFQNGFEVGIIKLIIFLFDTNGL